VHLIGFSIRIYHDARSPERQIQVNDLAFSPKCPDSFWGPPAFYTRGTTNCFPCAKAVENATLIAHLLTVQDM